MHTQGLRELLGLVRNISWISVVILPIVGALSI